MSASAHSRCQNRIPDLPTPIVFPISPPPEKRRQRGRERHRSEASPCDLHRTLRPRPTPLPSPTPSPQKNGEAQSGIAAGCASDLADETGGIVRLQVKRQRKKSSSAGAAIAGKTNEADAHPQTTIKPVLIQEMVRHDTWRMLVATAMLNVTNGKNSIPVFWKMMERWPTPEEMAGADEDELERMIHHLGLSRTRSSRIILFSRQYVDSAFYSSRDRLDGEEDAATAYGASTAEAWPKIPRSLSDLTPESVRPFAGAGTYAVDSFGIYSSLLPGGGGPAKEDEWVTDTPEKKIVSSKRKYLEKAKRDDSQDAWRKVMPKDKELIRYLKWRWGIEGIQWSPISGPLIETDFDAKRLGMVSKKELEVDELPSPSTVAVPTPSSRKKAPAKVAMKRKQRRTISVTDEESAPRQLFKRQQRAPSNKLESAMPVVVAGVPEDSFTIPKLDAIDEAILQTVRRSRRNIKRIIWI